MQLLESWLAAQNARSFPDYERSYASRFTGIKRTAGQTFKMNRPQWLADRRRMFPRITSVGATDIRVVLQGNTANLRFEQRWISQNYEDRGKKQLTIVLEDGTPRIAREELLESRVVDDRTMGEASDVHLVYWIDGSSYLVVGEGARVEEPELHQAPGTFVALGPANASSESSLQKWQGQTVRLLSSSGVECMAVGGKMYGLSLALPHFSEQGRWNDEHVPTRTRAEVIQGMSPPQYAVKLEQITGQCGTPALGQLATRPTLRVAVEKPDPKSLKLALAAFRRLPEFRKQQRELDEFRAAAEASVGKPAATESWIDYGPVIRHQQVFLLGDQTYVWLSINAGTGCGDWEGSLAMLFRVTSGVKDEAVPVALPNAGAYQPGKVGSLSDINQDSEVELLLNPTFSAGQILVDTNLKVLGEVSYVNSDCPC